MLLILDEVLIMTKTKNIDAQVFEDAWSGFKGSSWCDNISVRNSFYIM